jgi:hypothetical protein
MTPQASVPLSDAARPSTANGLPPLSTALKVRLTAEILRTYVTVRWQMRNEDVRVVLTRLRASCPSATQRDRPLARRLARAVARTLTFVPTDNRCLVRSLVLDSLLTRRSLQSVVVIAARTEPEFAAHAWVEHDETPLLPPGSERYKRLLEL